MREIKPATAIKIYGYSFKSRSKSLIKQANENSIAHLIKHLPTTQEKIDLVTERNPLLRIFADNIKTEEICH